MPVNNYQAIDYSSPAPQPRWVLGGGVNQFRNLFTNAVRYMPFYMPSLSKLPSCSRIGRLWTLGGTQPTTLLRVLAYKSV